MLRRWLIWTHRYAGIPLSVVFVVWFVSGIVLMYTGDMPRITSLERIERLDPARPRLSRCGRRRSTPGRSCRGWQRPEAFR